MAAYDVSAFYIDFNNRSDLTDDEKNALKAIQECYRPIERVDLLLEYLLQGKISSDEFESMTGIPYNYDL